MGSLYHAFFFSGILLLPLATTAFRCYYCDSATDPDCKYSQLATDESVDCATQCYNYHSEDGLVFKRGCLSSAITCPSSSTTCRKCTTELCNWEQMTVEFCASCDSSLDPNCDVTSNVTSIVQCPPTTAQKAGCYRHSSPSDGIVKRGCVADLDEEAFRVCSQADGEICKKCLGDACNLKDNFQRCFVCDSEEDADCLRVSLYDMKFATVCKDYLDSCAAFVIPNGKTVRGCLKEINPEPTYCPSTNCVICHDRDCNHDVVPPSRVLCYQCNSTADPTCNDALLGNPFLVATPCTTFKYDDQCFKYWDEETHTGFRGCLSDAGEAVALCAEHPERCAVCGDSYCNSDYLIRDARLWCSQCDRTAECLWSYRTPTLPCQNRVAFYETESCYKYFYPSGLKARRGCTLDDEEFCHEQSHHYHGTCDTCSTFFCNGDSFLTQSCVRCNSSESELCEDRATELPGEQCKVDPTYPQRGCFSFRDDLGVVHRGCHFDMEERWINNCETTYKNRCTRCYGQNCNTNLQGASDRVGVSIILPFLFVVGGIYSSHMGF